MSIAKGLHFAFRTPHASRRIVAGGLCLLSTVIVVGAFLTAGYLVRVLCDALEGRHAQLPKWHQPGTLLLQGILPVAAVLSYAAPLVALLAIQEWWLYDAGPNVATALFVARIALGVAIAYVLPLAIVHLTVKGRFSAAFDARAIARYLRANGPLYAGVWLQSLAVFVAAILVGIATAGVGLLFTLFAAGAVSAFLLGDAYRRGVPFEDDAAGALRASVVLPPPLSR